MSDIARVTLYYYFSAVLLNVCPKPTGFNCEINLDDCKSKPCDYGRCIDKINGYECACEPGYTGERRWAEFYRCSGGGGGVEGPLSFLGGAGRARWLVGPLLWNNGVGFPAMNEAGGAG